MRVDEVIESTIDTIQQCLGELAFGTEEDELEHSIARLLCERDLSLATAEWGTAGQISHWFGELIEPCPRYLGGVTVVDGRSLKSAVNVGPAEGSALVSTSCLIRSAALWSAASTWSYWSSN